MRFKYALSAHSYRNWFDGAAITVDRVEIKQEPDRRTDGMCEGWQLSLSTEIDAATVGDARDLGRACSTDAINRLVLIGGDRIDLDGAESVRGVAQDMPEGIFMNMPLVFR